MKLGICMDGGEDAFIGVIEKRAKEAGRPITYVELGVAYGETLIGVWLALAQFAPGSRAIGIERPIWEGLNSIRDRFHAACAPFVEGPVGLDVPPGAVGLVLGYSQDVLNVPQWPYRIDVAFIDACHCRTCAREDFLAVEKWMEPGGIVIFHDAGEAEQTKDKIPVCNEGIDVRYALNELGLFENKRVGWTFDGILPTKHQCAVFRRTPWAP